ncbi:cytochrome B561 [Marichromatium purpuratum 984]|uniref:Cytochrome B561 n=1 Tax=Marichromatium purpuratum 984 TaxID=765910 RepID=W0E0A0_MARPU|nr:cytochrome b/b6 domain-containing protein [Marichromatium purpuratum]AHF04280.1 cytochrome B561 [Marichromatium purpuratum 984]
MSTSPLYPLWLRAWHWYNAALFLALVVSGVSMHYAGTDWLLGFNQAVAIHNVSGTLLALGWIAFVLANLKSDNGRHYLPRPRGLVRDLWVQARYYAYGIFRDEPHPFHAGPAAKFNVLQQLSYLGAMYLLMPLLILSGLGFLLSPLLPETLLGISSLWLVAMTHVLTSYLLVLFLLVHVYIITIGDSLTANLRAMLTGEHGTSNDTQESDRHAS